MSRSEVSAYRKTKSTDQTGRGFGLLLGKPLRDRWVSPAAETIRLELDGWAEEVTVRLRKGFWNKCPEFMHDAIHGWIELQGLPLPWPKDDPYRFEMERINGAHFRVFRLRNLR